MVSVRAWGDSNFQPGEVWLDTDGKAIQAHGGGILAIGNKYFWYGEDRTIGRQSGVCCYSSTDLYNWKYEGVVFDIVSDFLDTSILQYGLQGGQSLRKSEALFMLGRF